ncbi:hypothetical protein PVAP13_5KG065909 [Panicum virgatum]|uniref:Uncharacterized protein n=1 Tax=Panicum virgatum TaxID=38727 RepID=A0A8T0SDU3_PANVG|nr:hypothetical protein PVAP13_5KG065909 [Panicum virgatum]
MPSLERRGNRSISLAPLYLNVPEVSSSTSIHGGPDADKVSIREVGAAAAALSPSDPTTRLGVQCEGMFTVHKRINIFRWVHTHKYASCSPMVASTVPTVMLFLMDQLLQWINEKV